MVNVGNCHFCAGCVPAIWHLPSTEGFQIGIDQPIRIQLEMVQKGEQLKSLCPICMLVPSIFSSEVLDAQKCCCCDQTAFTVLINFQNIKAEQVNLNCRRVLNFPIYMEELWLRTHFRPFFKTVSFQNRWDNAFFDPPDGIFRCYSSTKTE